MGSEMCIRDRLMDCMKMTGVSKAYQNGSEKLYALRDVNLVIEEGTFTAVMGRSGSGKTTLLNMMGALDQPTQGQVLFLGKDLGAMQEKELAALRRREIGFVFQKYQLLEEYDLWDNICVPIYLDHREPDRAYLEKILQVFGLSERKHAFPSQLSGGQQQRVAIARALAIRPVLILADEPTGNLDYKTGQEVLGLLRLSQRELGRTVVMVTHDRESAALCDRVVTIEDGRIVC